MKCNVCDMEMLDLGPSQTPPHTGRTVKCPFLEHPQHIEAAAKGVNVDYRDFREDYVSLPQICSVCKRRSDDPATPIKCYTGTYDHQWKNMTTNKDIDQPKEIYKGGAAATKIPGFKYIPLCSLERLAKRFELGLERHGKNSWNALNPESGKMLGDKEWLIERLSHVIHHCYKEIEFLASGQVTSRERDDNAAAIMWGGACLIVADERKLEYVENVGAASSEQ